MKFSYRELQKYFDKPLPAANEVGRLLGLHSFEFEGSEVTANGDTILEWDVLSNRTSDCLAYEGIVREINTVIGTPIKAGSLDFAFTGSGATKSSDMVALSVADETLVPRATKRIATGVTVGPSPAWLVELLESLGQRSINNVVDITNYTMLITGQPVHAFDYEKVAGSGKKTVSIRFAQDGEKVTDLSGKEHTLDKTMLVIADSEKALDIAGVKGGAVSGVDEKTTTLMLSACNFGYEGIRNTAKKLSLHTDASKRYEHQVPLHKIDEAMALMSKLITEVCGGVVADDIVETGNTAPAREVIVLDPVRTNSLLGTSLSTPEIIAILERAHCAVSEKDGMLSVTPPRERLDINIREDLIEEVGRLFGYANIPETPIEEGFPAPERNAIKHAQYKVADFLVASGFYEVYNRTITKEGIVKLKNPFTSELDSLRSNLITDIRARATRNLAFSEEPKLFEFGTVFLRLDGDKVVEEFNFAGVIGKRAIKDKEKTVLFLKTKGYIEQVISALDIHGVEFAVSSKEGFVADLVVDGEVCGHIGINDWELSWTKLVTHSNFTVSYKKPSKYPRISRDVAFFVPIETTIQDLEKLIAGSLPPETQELFLFDVFEKPEEKKKSVGFRMVFQSDSETLSDEWANAALAKVTDVLKVRGYEVR